MKFDAQVGNPPYNPNKEKEKSGHITTNLWSKFVDNAYDHLNPDGYLLYVHPPLWRKPDSETLKKFCESGHIECIRVFSQKESKNKLNFPVKVDYYSFKKGNNTGLTEIAVHNTNHNIDVGSLTFIPNEQFGTVYDIFTKSQETEVFYNCDYHHYTQNKTGRVRPEQTDSHKYKVLYLASKDGYVYHYANVKKSPHFGVPKIIVPMGRFDPILDLKGEIGMCEVAFAILGDKSYLKNVYKAFKTKEFKDVLDACKWKVMQLDYRLFKYLKKDFWKKFV